ncbi:MarR family winged helix-turn-helix transcriptional regulator [Phytomonospora endophytica]|uniref:DNA-binding MarR family transcriptional regulator n=1 Tax=Phytomonospora endophytica TaxID=714109 RepID=A0A841FX24_9ACTN|nr:MarR family transcriptional regulator [Phytomonospora endophytica]MBB6036520.1 DNA-binding MarR family transcriptional regulator [Phytomonospora endophytica]GIG65842.1 MarR family transcriptional regulator [Phytomonospora endophytica]
MLSHLFGYTLNRLQKTLRARMDENLASLGLSAPQYAVLCLLAADPGIANAELARRTFVTPPTMIRIVMAMEQAGLLARTPDPEGGRKLGARLTAEGERRLGLASKAVAATEGVLAETAGEDGATILRWLGEAADRLDGMRSG